MVLNRILLASAIFCNAISTPAQVPDVTQTPLDSRADIPHGESALFSLQACNLSHDRQIILEYSTSIRGTGRDEDNASLSFQAAKANNGYAITQWESTSDGVICREITARVINTKSLRDQHSMVQLSFNLAEFFGDAPHRTKVDIAMVQFNITLLPENVTATECTTESTESTTEFPGSTSTESITTNSEPTTTVQATPTQTSQTPAICALFSGLPPSGVPAIIGVLATVAAGAILVAVLVVAVALIRSKRRIPSRNRHAPSPSDRELGKQTSEESLLRHTTSH